MKSFVPQILKQKKKDFNLNRQAFFPKGTLLFLLARIGKTANFRVVLRVEADWYVHFNKYRFQYEFEAAKDDQDFRDAVGEASHMAIVIPTKPGVVYAIDPARRELDVLEPCGEEPWWHIFCQRKDAESFTPE